MHNVFKHLLLNCLKNLTLTLEEEISILDKYNLAPDELLVVKVLLLFQDDNQEELLHRLLTTFKHINIQLREVLIRLQEKGVILKSYNIPKQGEIFDPLIIPVNKNFIKNLYKCSFELGKELFETYPQFGSINGNIIPLRGVSRHFDSLEQAYFKYGKSIGFNPDKHAEIIELTKWGKDNNIINCSLSSYIINNGWLDLQAIKDGKSVNFNTDAIKLI